MATFLRRLGAVLTGRPLLPDGVRLPLTDDEHVVAQARSGNRHLIATQYGLWITDGTEPEPRRTGWHLISKAEWRSGALELTVADETGELGAAVLLTDRAVRRYPLDQPGTLPKAVYDRVTGSIRSTHRQELPGGAAWFVQRKVPGRDGVILQVRPDPGTDPAVVADLAAEVARKLGH
ncbi:hypothetical protein D5S17_08210 [Pseudonocardiaceae bacterium YIM PH 21723]|nr:hypothetical protein D5S17_08210 [Pseudonocardiaceae bacterium YIM PH 21723]